MVSQRKLIIILCIIILFLIIYNLYSSSSFLKSNSRIENFDNNLAVDLLNKINSHDAQITRTPGAEDLELVFYPWTTKLYNLQSNNNVKTIGLYKPNLSINGKKYYKLGDMLSQNTDYSPPENKESILLIDKVGSDVKPPINFNKIISFGDSNLPSIYRDFDNKLSPNMNVTSFYDDFKNLEQSLTTIDNILASNQQYILQKIIDTIASQQTGINISIGSQVISFNDAIKLPVTENGYGIISNDAINHETGILLPLGFDCKFYGWVGRNNLQLIESITGWGKDYDLNNVKLVKKKLQYPGLELMEIIGYPVVINLFNLIQPKEIIDFLTNQCNSLINILSNPGMTPELASYLKLGKLEDINKILSILSMLTPESYENNDIDNILNQLNKEFTSINADTYLGSLIQIKFNFEYPVMHMSPNGFIKSSGNVRNKGIRDYNQLIRWIHRIEIGPFNDSIIKKMVQTKIFLNNQNFRNNILSNMRQMSSFITAIKSNSIEYFPLRIYEPIPPEGYIAVGHVFGNKDNDLQTIKTMNNIVCVPRHCVRDMRDWIATDKVFEYNQGGVYWAIYKNPYIGTFISVNKPEPPEGKVPKVVACVAKCSAVDDLKKADECARTYQKINNKINEKLELTTSSLTDIVSDTEDSIFLKKIKDQNDNLIRLQKRAQLLQTDIDKADIITQEMNKAKMQNYVDTQKRNIELVAERLERDKNKIDANINIPTDVLNRIINIIQNLPNIPPVQKQTIINKIIQNAQASNAGLMTQEQYNVNLNNILRSCPQYDLSGLVKKSLVGDVCYGCGTPE